MYRKPNLWLFLPLLLAACVVRVPDPAPSTTPLPPTATVMTATPFATATAVPTATPTPPPAGDMPADPAETPAAQTVAPVVEGARLSPSGWSPESRYYLFWQHTEEDFIEQPQYPPGTLTAYDVSSGATCPYPRSLYDGAGQQNRRHTWLPGDLLMVFHEDGSYAVVEPCRVEAEATAGDSPEPIVEVGAVDASRTRYLLRGESQYWLMAAAGDGKVSIFTPVAAIEPDALNAYAFSQGGNLLAINFIDGGTAIVDANTGETLRSYDWAASPGLGSIFRPMWLRDDLVLVQSSADKGPLLLQGDGTVQAAAALMVALPPAASQMAQSIATGPDSFVVAVRYFEGTDEFEPGIWLYHAATGVTEGLDFDRWQFDESGRRMLLFRDHEDGDQSQYEVWWRLIDPEAEPVHLATLSSFPHSGLAQQGEAAFVSDASRLELFTTGGGHSSYDLLRYPFVNFVPDWSPNGRFLAAFGGLSGRADQALFIIPGP